VLPLATVLGKVAREVPGQVLKVEFEREDGRFIYEIRLLQNDGRVVKLKVDAVDGRVLAIKRKDTARTGMRILVVEDEPTLREQLMQAIAAAGHTVEARPTGARRITWARWNLRRRGAGPGPAGADGLSVLRRWRAAGRNMPVLILTARGAGMKRSRAWTPAPTTTWPSPFTWKSCWRACARCCAGGEHASAEWRCGPSGWTRARRACWSTASR
jgi:CheY-like chemotaxis protein